MTPKEAGEHICPIRSGGDTIRPCISTACMWWHWLDYTEKEGDCCISRLVDIVSSIETCQDEQCQHISGGGYYGVQ